MRNRKEDTVNKENTFARFEKLPTDLKNLVLQNLSGKDILKQLPTSRNFNQNAKFNKEYKIIQKGRAILNAATDVPLPVKNILNNYDGYYVLGYGLITVEIACKFTNLAKLGMLVENKVALKEGCITLNQAKELVPKQLKLLLSENGMFAMKNKLIKPQNAADISIDGLSKFLQKENLQQKLKQKLEDQDRTSSLKL